MKIIAVDDEPLALDTLKAAIQQAEPGAAVYPYLNAAAALDFAASTPCDAAFLDIELPDMDGLALAKRLKDENPRINIVFVTGYSQYMSGAFSLYVSGYALKPVDAERVRRELDNLRIPPAQTPRHRLRIQCFGSFEAFADEMPIPFSRKKSKELLAYLVDRQGASVSLPEAAGVLFEDSQYSRSRQRQMQYVVTDLRRSLERVRAESILVRQRSILSVDPAAFDCDLNRFLAGDAAAVNAYRGEYMAQYSWAEFSFRG